jgi:hypothetical protein
MEWVPVERPENTKRKREESDSEDEGDYSSPDIVGDTLSDDDLRDSFIPPRAAVPWDYFRLLVSALEENENLYVSRSLQGNPSWDHTRRVQAFETVHQTGSG